MQKPESQEAGQVSEGCDTSCRIVISQVPDPHPQLVPLGEPQEPGDTKATSGSGATSPGRGMLLTVSSWKHPMRLCVQGYSVLPLPVGETESSKDRC